MAKNIAVLGAGANGSSVGADLTKAGYAVLLVDQWPAHIEAMKAKGLRIMMPERELHTPVEAIHLCDLRTLRPEFDIVLLAAKSNDTHWMVHFILPYLKPDGVLVSLQNSLNDEWIAPVIGYERDIASVVELSSELFEPGLVKRNTDNDHTWFALGELHGRVTPRLQEVAKILSVAGKTEISTNIWGAKWTKLAVNCMAMAVSSILGISDHQVVRYPKVFDLCIKLGKECLQVGTTLGYRIEPIFGLNATDFLGSNDEVLKKHLEALFSAFDREKLKVINSIRQDHLRGRPSEIDFLNGLVVEKGKKAKVPTPLNEAITSLTKQIEQGTLKPGLSNLPLLERLVS
jgi:2-dehydropantoate 2-reductase